MTKRSHGDGGIDNRGENVHRLRYRVDGKRFTKTFRGTLTEARKALRALIRSGDTGEHVAPDRISVGAWLDQWIKAGAPGRRREKVSQRTLERYEQLLNTHVKPVVGSRRLQQLQPQEIDALYSAMAEAAIIASQTQHPFMSSSAPVSRPLPARACWWPTQCCGSNRFLRLRRFRPGWFPNPAT
jgi:integrase